jgi:uncharacterized damage-inducible protein DinB
MDEAAGSDAPPTALAQQHIHNRWANAKLLAACASAAPDVIAPLLERLNHMIGIEARFRAAIAGEALTWERSDDIAELARRADAAEAGLAAIAATLTPEVEARTFSFGRMPRPVSVREALLQVLSHSGQHRAEVAWELHRAGIDAGNLDFIAWALWG